ncbi:MAG: hypothetical protein HBSAPP03_26070 [Phycisphaerae bacterium]|nr:MAG: hypothetical protein HBSAPP03_26070 [Phycisphaerae bacterium]
MADAGTTKVCSVCGIDVSNRPRVKDAAGRYMCQDCLQKAKAARGAQTAPKPKPPATTTASPTGEDDNSFLLSLGGKDSVASKGVQLCPECGRAMDHGAVVCVGCGYNTSTGKRLQVKVQKAEKPKGEAKAKSGGGETNPHLYGVAMLAGVAIFAGAAFYVKELAVVYLVVALIAILVSRIWALIAAWQDTTWKGVIILIGWFFGLLWLYELYWVAVEAENVVMKWFWFSSLLAGISAMVIQMMAAGGGGF